MPKKNMTEFADQRDIGSSPFPALSPQWRVTPALQQPQGLSLLQDSRAEYTPGLGVGNSQILCIQELLCL